MLYFLQLDEFGEKIHWFSRFPKKTKKPLRGKVFSSIERSLYLYKIVFITAIHTMVTHRVYKFVIGE